MNTTINPGPTNAGLTNHTRTNHTPTSHAPTSDTPTHHTPSNHLGSGIRRMLLMAMLLPAVGGAQADCVTDAPEIGDIGPGADLVCDQLQQRFAGSVLAVAGRSILSPTEVLVLAAVDEQQLTMRYELDGFDWRLSATDASMGDEPRHPEGRSSQSMPSGARLAASPTTPPTHLTASPAASSPATPPAAPLIDAAGLKPIACEPGVVVLDLRSDKIDGQSRADYVQGHIPCAVFSDYIKDGWRAKVNGVPGMLPPVGKLEALIGGLGIDDETRVVIAPVGADAKSIAGAARVYWTFKVLGHDRVSILDGGTQGYADDASRVLEQGERTPKPKSFTASLRPEMLVSDEELARAGQTDGVLVDYRRQDEFSGLNRNAKTERAGSIAGAHNVPLEWLTRNNGGFLRSRQGFQQLYALADVPTDAEQIAFCNTGHNSSLGWFVAHEILGNRSVRVYDGSMAQWSRDPALPMERSVAVTD